MSLMEAPFSMRVVLTSLSAPVIEPSPAMAMVPLEMVSSLRAMPSANTTLMSGESMPVCSVLLTDSPSALTRNSAVALRLTSPLKPLSAAVPEATSA